MKYSPDPVEVLAGYRIADLVLAAADQIDAERSHSEKALDTLDF
jgi:hypothetical protein